MGLAETCSQLLAAADHPRSRDPSLLSLLELRSIRSEAQFEAKNHEPIKASAAKMLRYMMEVNDWIKNQIVDEVGVPRQEISRALADGTTFPFPLAKKLSERFGHPLSLYVD